MKTIQFSILALLLTLITAKLISQSYNADFNTGVLPASFKGSSTVYKATVSGGAFVLDADNPGSSTESWFEISDVVTHDISGSKTASFKIKGTRNFVFNLRLEDNKARKIEKTTTVYAGSDYSQVYFDLSVGAGSFDFANVSKIYIAPDVITYGYERVVISIDQFSFGDPSQKYASIARLPNVSFYKNTGSKKIVVRNVSNYSNIIATGAASLVKNLVVIPNDGKSATVSFDLIENAAGTDKIKIIAKGQSGFSDDSTSFNITISDNNPPSLNGLVDTLAQVGIMQTLELSGITDGDSNTEQLLSFTATSSNESVIPSNSVTFDCEQGLSRGNISYTPLMAGETLITIKLKDNSGALNDSCIRSFKVKVYKELNFSPTINKVKDFAVSNTAGEQSIILNGISSGDEGVEQPLSLNLTSSNNSIFQTEPSIIYTSGNKAVIKFTTDAAKSGSTKITITVNDNAVNADNNGSKSTVMAFNLKTYTVPPTGYSFKQISLANFDNWNPATVNISVVDSGAFKALKFAAKEKVQFDCISINLPYPIDVTDNIHFSFDVFSPVAVNASIAFIDANGVMGEDNIVEVAKGLGMQAKNRWNHVVVSYDSTEMSQNGGAKIVDLKQITKIRIMVHNTYLEWVNPVGWTKWTGDAYFRNFKIGSEAGVANLTECTVNQLPDQYLPVSGSKIITLKGVSNGGGTGAATYLVKTSNGKICTIADKSAVNADSTAKFNLTPGSIAGTAQITIMVSAPGSVSKSMVFNASVLDSSLINSIAEIAIDTTKVFQTMRGLGFMGDKLPDEVYTDLGATVSRLGIFNNQVEPFNDNDDPEVLDMSKLNKNVLDWNLINEQKTLGVKYFIITSWSPASWMKLNFNQTQRENINFYNNNAAWTKTLNRLDTNYLAEFAESMFALVKMFKQESGMDLFALSIQNEPFISLNYSSCAMTDIEYAMILKAVGRKFKKEGIKTLLFGPEQSFDLNQSYVNRIQKDAETDSYFNAIACHSNSDGINVDGSINSAKWLNFYNLGNKTGNKKELWGTEVYFGDDGLAGNIDNGLSYAADIMRATLGGLSLWTTWAPGRMYNSDKSRNHFYYTSKHLFKYLTDGTQVIESSSSVPTIWPAAYKNPADSTYTLIIINKSDAKRVKLSGLGIPKQFKAYRTSANEFYQNVGTVGTDEFIMPAKSIITLHGKYTPGINIDPVSSVSMLNNESKVINLTGIRNADHTVNGLTLTHEIESDNLFSEATLSSINTDGSATLTVKSTSKVGVAKVKLILSNTIESDTVVLFIQVGTPNSVNTENNEKLSVYPNPVRNMLTLMMSESGFNNAQIYDSAGKVVKSLSFKLSEKSKIIEVNSLLNGVYFISLKGADKAFNLKFVKM